MAKPLLGDRNRSLHPDLVFGDNDAVRDVKYRLASTGEIRRNELNQVTTFATGYHATKATILAFGPHETGEEVRVGPVQVNGFNWNTQEPTPEQAAARIADRIAAWLTAPS
jgi:hypothetical protein